MTVELLFALVAQDIESVPFPEWTVEDLECAR